MGSEGHGQKARSAYNLEPRLLRGDTLELVVGVTENQTPIKNHISEICSPIFHFFNADTKQGSLAPFDINIKY